MKVTGRAFERVVPVVEFSFGEKSPQDDIGTEEFAIRWQGSGDLAAVAKSNCFLYIPADRSRYECGEPVSVLPRRDVL